MASIHDRERGQSVHLPNSQAWNHMNGGILCILLPYPVEYLSATSLGRYQNWAAYERLKRLAYANSYSRLGMMLRKHSVLLKPTFLSFPIT